MRIAGVRIVPTTQNLGVLLCTRSYKLQLKTGAIAMMASWEGMMGMHIIWRNPFPPRKREFKLRRAAGNNRVALYQVAGPRHQSAFELVRSPGCPTAIARNRADPIAAPFGAELVLARW